jgi:hypothetical protein
MNTTVVVEERSDPLRGRMRLAEEEMHMIVTGGVVMEALSAAMGKKKK